MTVVRCKMCGVELEITEGMKITECNFCGTKQTIPSADNEKKIRLYNRANKLRLSNRFDKALDVFERNA